MGKKKVVLDTNIVISALAYDGPERRVFSKCINREFILYITTEILEEVSRVLEYPKFAFSSDQKSRIKLALAEAGNLIPIIERINIVSEDPSDNIFLEAAISSEADFLVTGDKHLLKIKQIGKTAIVRAPDCLDQ